MSDAPTLPGLHHVTAIAGDPARNLRFFQQTLGQRLVKRTVNFDDPGTYHLYYADGVGSPGTVITFFPFAGARPGREGAGQVDLTSYAVPVGALDFWARRLGDAGLQVEPFEGPFGEKGLRFQDPDGLGLTLVETGEAPPIENWADGPDGITADVALQGFHGVRLREAAFETTCDFLEEVMGFAPVAEDGDARRFRVGEEEAPGRQVDVVRADQRAVQGSGTVHHIAFRVTDDAAQVAWRERLLEHGIDVTPVIDRQYFHSIYFREPGGVLFEIATDPPGFTVDEEVGELGSSLRLPPQYEPARDRIEKVLPPLP